MTKNNAATLLWSLVCGVAVTLASENAAWGVAAFSFSMAQGLFFRGGDDE